MLLSIQWSHILSAIATYVKLKTEGDQFDETKARRNLRAASVGASSLNTVVLAYSLGVPFDETGLLLAVVVIVIIWALDCFFIRS